MDNKESFNKPLTPEEIILLDSADDIIEKYEETPKGASVTIRTTRASGSFSKRANETTHISVVCNWSSTGNSASNSSSVSANLKIDCNMRGSCLSGSHLTINGNRKNYTTTINNASGSGVNTNTLCSHSVSGITHNADGSKSITISFAWVWNGYVWHTNYSGNISTVSSSSTVTLDQLAKHPTAPTLGKPSNANYNDGNGYIVYAGGNISFKTSGGSNVAKRKLHLECYYPSSGWATWTPNSGWNAWSNSSSEIAATFSGTGNNRGYIYRVTAWVQSSTGHTAHATTFYFKVNDWPSVSGFKTSASRTSGAFTLSHNGISDSINNGLKTRYYRMLNGSWSHIADGGSSYGLNITNYASVGQRIEFAIQPYDGLEWGDLVRGVFVERIQVYSKPTLQMEGASNNSTFNYQSYPVYAGDQNIYFAVANAGSYDKCKIRLGYYDHRDGNKWKYWEPTGFNSWHDAPNPHHHFSSANNDRGFKWGAQAVVKSASGDETGGDWKYFWINDLPRPGNFRRNVARTRDMITVDWDSQQDTINQGDFRFQIANYKNGNHYLIAESSGGRSKTFSLVDAGAVKGERLELKMRVKDYLEFGPWSTGHVSVIMNSDPYFDSNAVITSDKDSSQYNRYFDDYINFTFPLIRDADTTSGSQYRIEYCVHNGSSWSSWKHLMNRTSASFNHSFASLVPRGHKLRIQVKPIDDLGAIGTGKISQDYTRTSAPSPPSSITLNSSKYRENHYETLESVTWSAGSSSAGAIAEYRCVLQVLSGGTVVRESTHLSTSTSARPPLTFVNRGEDFRIRVQAKDKFGNWSNPAQTTVKSRNEVPARVNNFRANGSKPNYYGSVSLVWDATSDPDNDSIRYEIHHRTEVGPWTVVADSVRGTTYTHSIEGYAPGIRLGYKIVPIDQLDARGAETLMIDSDNITVNIPPASCVPFAPFDDPVYAKRPRLLIDRVVSDGNGDELTLEVNLGGQVYTSSANPEMFNKRSYSSNERAAFRPPSDLSPGSHIVRFRTYDGMQYSPPVQETLEIKEILESNKNSRVDYITANSINRCIQMIEANNIAYKKDNSVTQVHQGKAVKSSEINTIFKSAYDLAKYITSKANGLEDSHNNLTVSKDQPITTDFFNRMLEIIKTP